MSEVAKIYLSEAQIKDALMEHFRAKGYSPVYASLTGYPGGGIRCDPAYVTATVTIQLGEK